MGEAVAQRLVVPAWLKNGNMGASPVAGREAFLEKTLQRVYGMRSWFFDDKTGADGGGVIRSLDPAARIGGALLLIIGASLAGDWQGLGIIALITAITVLLSRVSVRSLVKRTLPIFIFTSIVVLPLFFDISAVKEGHGWFAFFHAVPSAVGLRRAGFFLARSTLMAGLVALLGLTTSRSEFMSGLRKFPLPPLFVTVIFLTLANISRLLGLLEDAVLARKARTISGSNVRDMEGWFAGRARYLMERAMSTSEEVAMAMASRGFNGRLRTLKTRPGSGRDFSCIGICAFVSILALLF